MSTIDFENLSRAQIEAAVWVPEPERARSDFDLNPEARAHLPPHRRLRPAAVLCAVMERESGLQVVLTRRADHLKKHPGQIAFPGGKVDPGDPSPLGAALREAEEEIGLSREQVDITGPLDRYETSTGFQITPFVGFIEGGFHPITDDGEVAEVFEVPLGHVLNPVNHERRSRDWQGTRRWFWAMPYQDRYIWGATAGILRGLCERLHRAHDLEPSE
ncbi:MAG: CoA pyrophosphatase [Neomegalonema sp.]|nr:CoA pyrophosphatase [Neomegalonema sp.]